jgi:hypothetical protein
MRNAGEGCGVPPDLHGREGPTGWLTGYPALRILSGRGALVEEAERDHIMRVRLPAGGTLTMVRMVTGV